MTRLKLSIVALAVTAVGLVACGGDGKKDAGDVPTISRDSGSGGMGGSGGGIAIDAGVDQAMDRPDAAIDSASPEDRPSQRSDVGPGLDGPPGGGSSPCFDCTGLTAEQCHDKIINATGCILDTSILTQDPGADPAVPFPTCSAI